MNVSKPAAPPGTGKSHIAKALALFAVNRGYKVIYREAHQLIEDINEARELGAIRKLRTQFRAADLLIIDDLFLRKLPAQAADELADVLMSRYEKGATIITSNRPLEDWPKLLGDVVATPLGNEGIPFGDGHDVVIRGDGRPMAVVLNEIGLDPGRLHGLGEHAARRMRE